MSIKLIYASVVDQEVDAIVNAANKYLVSGSGVCGEIFKRAGYQELGKACSKIKTPLNDGDAVITDSFNINNCKYIIHAVGPDFNITSESYDKLFNAYYNSLEVLKNNNLHSIAFPLISSGIYGGNNPNPAKLSAEQCLKAYNKFIEDNQYYNLEVLLCAYSESEYIEVKRLFE